MSDKPLVDIVKSLIERTYGLPPAFSTLEPFIVGDAGLARYYGEREGSGARVLVRWTGDVVRAAFYCPDALVQHLETFNPLQGLGDVNISQFAALVEEIDHLLTLASRVAEGRSVTMLELEHHANVTKYLVVLHFLGRLTGRGTVREPLRHWARHHLFERYSDGATESERRYREAARLAWKYLSRLDRLRGPAERLAEIRAFHRRPFSEVLRTANLN